jgi:hypothetical protein
MTVQTTGGMGSGAISFGVSRNTQGARKRQSDYRGANGGRLSGGGAGWSARCTVEPTDCEHRRAETMTSS